jgi:predicted  nucleic acid-binding Zn-ribbon protein
MIKRMIKKLNDSLNQRYEMNDSNIFSLMSEIQILKDRVEVLEQENIETTNELYRLENSLDARIDILYNEFRNK